MRKLLSLLLRFLFFLLFTLFFSLFSLLPFSSSFEMTSFSTFYFFVHQLFPPLPSTITQFLFIQKNQRPNTSDFVVYSDNIETLRKNNSVALKTLFAMFFWNGLSSERPTLILLLLKTMKATVNVSYSPRSAGCLFPLSRPLTSVISLLDFTTTLIEKLRQKLLPSATYYQLSQKSCKLLWI